MWLTEQQTIIHTITRADRSDLDSAQQRKRVVELSKIN